MIWAFVRLLLGFFNGLVLAYFVALNGVYLITSLRAYLSLRRYSSRLKALDIQPYLKAEGAPPMTLLAPAYNEEPTCVQSTKSLLTLNYADYEILVINDGSKDKTLERMKEAFDLAPAARLAVGDLATKKVREVYQSRVHHNLWVIDKENGGKADTLNAGINYARTPFFCAMDADSLLEPEALIRVVRPFLEDETTIAVGGIIRIVNDCRVESGQVTDVRMPRNLLASLQVLEYLRAFLSGRMGWDALDATLVISGAFGVFRRDLVIQVGGYATDTVGEDMELVVRMHRHCRENAIPYRIAFVPDPVAWTECPESVKVLSRQRDRWQRGLIETLLRHRKMLLNPRYGRVGMVAFPYFFFLEMCGPIIEFLGYISFAVAVILGVASKQYIIAFLLVAFVFGTVLSVSAVALEELGFRRYLRLGDLFRLLGLSVVENFGYRQLSTFWRMKGTVSAMRGQKGWGRMERRGFAVPKT